MSGTVHEKDWFAGYWRCEVCHVTVASPEGEPDECPSHPTRSGYPDGIETEWEPLVQAAQLPPEDHAGEIECARCGEVFLERNDGVSWLCRNTDCMGHITAREPPTEVLAEPNDVPETEQATLIPDGGRVEDGTEREETQTVDLVGPTRFRVELTDEELERAKESDSPLAAIDRNPVEWEPIRDNWEVHTDGDA